MTTPALVPRLHAVPDSPDSRDTDEAAEADEAADPLLIVVGGVPGAGKSTLLAQVADELPGAVVLDPDRLRRRLAARLPSWVPYVTYRWTVHAWHAVATVAHLVHGPRSTGPLLVHDTATRRRRRESLGLLARAFGWDPVLVAVDVSLADALDGQLDRGRVVQPEEFVRHWERWTAQRSMLAAAAGGPLGPWSSVYLMERCDALGQVHGLARRRSAVPVPARTAVRPAGPPAGRPCAA